MKARLTQGNRRYHQAINGRNLDNVHFRDRGDIVIKLGTATGSDNLAMGTQQVKIGTGIPIHRHFKMDEAFYVLEGSGSVVLEDVRRGRQRA